MFSATGELNVLAIGAHPDDIELGAGGLLYRLLKERSARVQLLILSPGLEHWKRGRKFDRNRRVDEALEGAVTLGVPPSNVEVLNFPDCQLHLCSHDLIKQIERKLFAEPDAPFDLILAHAEHDTHSDHRQAYEATVAAARAFHGAILLYQAVSTIPNNFRPTFFVSLTDEAIDAKQKALEQHESQRAKDFMKRIRTECMARGWALFLRRTGDFLEAFETHRAFWNHARQRDDFASLPA